MADVTVGRSVPLQPGPQPSSQSLSTVFASDIPPIATFDAFGGTGELDKDLLGNPRSGTPQLLLASVRRYEIDSKIWASKIDSNSQGRIVFDPNKSAARLAIQSGNNPRTYASLQTKINFPYQAGRNMDTSYGIQCSRGIANENVVIEFGPYDNDDGYGFRILYEDGKDKLLIFRRTSSGETAGLVARDSIPYLNGHSELMGANAYEQIIEVGNSTASGYTVGTNGNRLDGTTNGAVDVNGNPTSTGHKLSLFDSSLTTATNLTMFRVRYSWYGASGADFWAFVPLDKIPKPGVPRWVRIQSIPIGGNLQFPSLKNPDKPLTFRIYRRADKTLAGNVPSANAFLSTFGTSFSIDAGDPKPMEIFSASSGLVTLTNSLSNPILGLRIKPTIKSSINTTTGISVDTPNQLRAYPLQLSISSTAPCSFTLLKNPTNTSTFPVPVAADLSAINTATSLGSVTSTTGKVCGTFYTGTNDGQTVDLTEIFAYNREFIGREAQADINTAGDTLYIMARDLIPTATINTLTSTSTTATATVNAGHPYKTGDYVTVTGATPTEYNLTAVITVLNATQFTYTVASGLTTPATGTITSDLNVNVSASLTWGQQ
jgi:hypothetical protein